MNKVTLAGLALVLAAGCGVPPNSSAIHVQIKLAPGQKATCVLLDIGTATGDPLAQRKLERGTLDVLDVAIFRGEFPPEIVLKATPEVGARCANPLFQNGDPFAQHGFFPDRGKADVLLSLAAPPANKDADHDGVVGVAFGGADCNDSDATVYPGAPESCTAGIDSNCNGLVGCGEPACAGQQCTTPPATAAFTTAAQRISAGACSAAVTLEARDANGARLTVSSATPVALTSSDPAMVLYSDLCTTSTGGVVIPQNAADATFHFRSTAAGSPVITATISGGAPVTQTETLDPGSPIKLGYATNPQTLGAGSCSQRVTLRAEDALGNASPVTAAASVALSASQSSGFLFYSDSGCQVAISGVTIPAGTATTGFYFKSTRAAQVTVTADGSGAGLGTVNQVELVQPGAATTLAFLTGPQTVNSGACSGRTDIQLQDASANAVPAGSAMSVTLSASGLTFYSDACLTPLGGNAISIPAGEPAATFYFRGTAVSAPLLTATPPGVLGIGSASQTENIIAGGASTLVFTTAPQTTLKAGGCSAAMTVQAQDSFSQRTFVGSDTVVSLTGTPTGAVTFYALGDTNCTGTAIPSATILNGQSDASFRFKSTAAATIRITGSSTPLNPAMQDEPIGPGAASGIEFTTGSVQTATAGICSGAVGLRTKDAFQNDAPVAAPTSINLTQSSTGGTWAFYTDASCTGPTTSSVSIATGGWTAAFYFKTNKAESVTITANGGGTLGTATQGETISAGSPAQIGFYNTQARTITAGQCSGAVGPLNVRAQDAYGNAAPVPGGGTVLLSATPPDTFSFFSDSNCNTAITQLPIAASASSTTPAGFYFSSTRAGSVDVKADGSPLAAATQAQTVTAATATRIVFTSLPQTLQSGVCGTVTATVEVHDQYGNLVGGARSLTLADNMGGNNFLFFNNNVCTGGGSGITSISTDATGKASFWMKGVTLGTATVTVSSTGLVSATQDELVGSGPPTKLVFTTAPFTVAVGTCEAMAVQVQDTNSNPVSVLADTAVGLLAGDPSLTFYSDAACGTSITSTTVPQSTSSVTFYARGTAVLASVSVTASSGSLTQASQTEVITAGPPAALKFSSATQTVTADTGCSPATVGVVDSAGNTATVGAATSVAISVTPTTGFTLYSDNTCTAAASSVQIASGGSSATFYFVARTAGSFTLKAVSAPLTNGTQAVTVNPGAARLVHVLGTAQTLAAGACSAAVTVQIEDGWNNAKPVGTATAVNLSANPNSGSNFKFYSDACTTEVTAVQVAALSATQAFHFKGTVATPLVVTAASTGLSSGTQNETITPAGASGLSFSTQPQTVLVGGCSGVVTVQSVDTYGNQTADNGAVSLTDSGGANLGTYSNNTCTTAAGSVSLTNGSASFWFKMAAGGTPGTYNVTATYGAYPPATQPETITGVAHSGSCTIADGASTSADCTLSPIITEASNAILFFQATHPTAADAASASVMCSLPATGPATSLTCERAGTTGAVTITWYIAEFLTNTGVRVQRVSGTCPNNQAAFSLNLSPTVNYGTTFVLWSGRRNSTSSAGTTFKQVVLNSNGQTVDVTMDQNCSSANADTLSVQVVTFPGAQVDRGSVSLTGQTGNKGGLPNITASRTFLLYSWSSNAASNSTTICDRMVRGYINGSNNTVYFARTNNTSGCTANTDTVTFERVQLPSGNTVAEPTGSTGMAMANNAGTVSASGTFDLNKAVAFMGGQSTAGQATGEGDNVSGDVFGTKRATVDLTGSQVTLTRDATSGAARFNVQVVQFAGP